MLTQARPRSLPFAVLAGAAIAVLTVVIFLPPIRSSFVADDWVYMQMSQAHGWWHHSPVTDVGGVLFRPVFYLYIGTAFAIAGLHALPVHLATVFIILLEGLATWRLARLQGLKEGALVAGAVVALNATQAIPIAWTSAVSSPLSVTLALVALVCVTRDNPSRYHYALAALAFGLGLLTREVVIVMPAILIVLILARSGVQGTAFATAIKRALPFLIEAASYVVWRVAGGYPPRYVGAYQQHISRHAMANAAKLARWTSIVVSPDHTLLSKTWSAAFWIALVGVAVWAALRRRSLLPAAGIIWTVLALLPVVFLVAHRMDLYYTDFALPGVALTLGAMFQLFAVRKHPRGAVLATVLLLAIIGAALEGQCVRNMLGVAPAVDQQIRADRTPPPKCYPPSAQFSTGSGSIWAVLNHQPGLHVPMCR